MDLSFLTQPPGLYVALVVLLVVVALMVWGAVTARRKRRERDEMRERYGAEFDRAVAEHGNRRAAVADLKAREAEYETLSLHDLNDADLDLVRRHMAAAQFRFVEDPADALMRVERVMTEVLRARGYPVTEDRGQAVRLFSVERPDHASAFRNVLDDATNGDIDDLRNRFLEARKTISDVTGASYVLEDAAPAPADLHIEQTADPELTTGSHSS